MVRSPADTLPDQATGALLGANPFLGVSPSQLGAATVRFALHAARHAPAVANDGARLAGRLARVSTGRATTRPEPGDRRFADDAFDRNPLYRRLMQGYLEWRSTLYGLVDHVGLDDKSASRARFAASLVAEALAPTNALVGNPAALRAAVASRGRTLTAGARHLAGDIARNGAMPKMVDTRPFVLGETVASTPGAVVHRSEVLELIEYAPVTPTVHARPIVIVPPQINKYWVLDLAPGRSLLRHLLAEGHRVFMVSWRNPTPTQRDWSLDTYVDALYTAVETARRIARADSVNVTGACAGGITATALLGHLAARRVDLIQSVTLLVTVLDMAEASAMTLFLSEPAAAAAIRRSRRRGVLEGRELARVFAWLRPNDLVWSFWVNNYLLGGEPPAFDVLAWNDDTTNLPAGLHADFLTIALSNALAEPDRLEVLGTPVDLAKVDCDAYVMGGVADHITPWETCYRNVHLLGGRTEFVLSGGGHVQALVNPPGNPKSRYFVNPDGAGDARAWLAGAEERQGSWWEHWTEWLAPRAGEEVPAPRKPGNRTHPAIEPAPGRYVRG